MLFRVLLAATAFALAGCASDKSISLAPDHENKVKACVKDNIDTVRADPSLAAAYIDVAFISEDIAAEYRIESDGLVVLKEIIPGELTSIFTEHQEAFAGEYSTKDVIQTEDGSLIVTATLGEKDFELLGVMTDTGCYLRDARRTLTLRGVLLSRLLYHPIAGELFEMEY